MEVVIITTMSCDSVVGDFLEFTQANRGSLYADADREMDTESETDGDDEGEREAKPRAGTRT